jgi:hypothetical protein
MEMRRVVYWSYVALTSQVDITPPALGTEKGARKQGSLSAKGPMYTLLLFLMFTFKILLPWPIGMRLFPFGSLNTHTPPYTFYQT